MHLVRKADLLEAIARTGSISQAAKSMNMSYRRAWQLVDTMNQCFETALVETQTGNTWWWGSYHSFGPESLTALPSNGKQCPTALEHDYQIMSSYLKVKIKDCITMKSLIWYSFCLISSARRKALLHSSHL